MSEPARGPNTLHADQVAFWSGEGGQMWLRSEARIEPTAAALGSHALAAAAPRPGEGVLDVGCGLGGTTRALARAVAPTGHVLGLDLSAVMMEEAARRAAAEGLSNVRFAACDAATYGIAPASIDLLFSRFGVMFFGDPPAAFAHLRRALKPGGRVTFLCWRSFKENAWALVPFMAAAPFLPPLPRPGPNEPGPFAFGDAARVRDILTTAGFADIAIDALDQAVSLSSGSLEEAVSQATEIGPLSRAMRDASAEARARAIDAVRAALKDHMTPDGVRLAAACWVVRAGNPR